MENILKEQKKEEEIIKDIFNAQKITILKAQPKWKEKAKAEGVIVDSVEKLQCEHHPGERFIPVEEIKGSFILKEDGSFEVDENGLWQRLFIYGCPKCQNGSTLAYQCPFCGIVKEGLIMMKYNFDEIRGQNFHCKICYTFLGHIWFKR